MHIRRINQNDLDKVIKIEQESPSPWTPAQLTAELLYSGSIIFIAEDNENHLLGWCCARIAAGEAELLKIAVSRAMRNKGVGCQLLERLMEELYEKNVATIFLEVRSRNTSALHFYKKNGFLQVGMRPGYYSSPMDNALIFRKDLPYIGN